MSMQESVVREEKREAGTAVQVIRYFGSQPWPFPYSLMIAYTATYTAGEISIDDTEIEEKPAGMWLTTYLSSRKDQHRSQINRLVRQETRQAPKR